MTGRRVLLACLVAILLVGFAWWLEVERPRRAAVAEEARTRLASGVEEIEQVIVEHPAMPGSGRASESYTMTRRDDGSWSLVSSTADSVLKTDMRALNPLLKALASSRIEQELSARFEDLEDRSQFGLEPPPVIVTWREKDRAARSLALGSHVPGLHGSYARTDDGRLVLVPLSLLNAINFDSGWFREKSVLGNAAKDPQCIEIERIRDYAPGAMPLLRFGRDEAKGGNPDSWRMTWPIDTLADRMRFGAFVSKISNVMAQGFGAENPSEEELRSAGLLPPAAIVRVRSLEAEEVVLEIGDESYDPDSTWARVPGGPLVLVRVDLRWDALQHEVLLRDARPFVLDPLAVTSVHWKKGVKNALELEIVRVAEDEWERVLPLPGKLPLSQVSALLDALFEPSCGRFEDVLAANAPLANGLFSFTGPGSASFAVKAMTDEGEPLSLDAEVSSPFTFGRDMFSAVRTKDGAARPGLCIVKVDAYDLASGLARSLATMDLDKQPRKP